MKKQLLVDQSVNTSVKQIDLSVKKVIVDLEIAAIVLAILSVAGQSLKYLTIYDEAFGLIPLVNMAKALSIPTIFTVLVAFVSAILLGIITAVKLSTKDEYRGQWLGLAIFFFLTALDKGSAMGTYFFKQFRNLMRTFIPAFPEQKWITTFVILMIILIVFYSRFIKTLPQKTRLWSLISLLVYYAGFLFIERFADHYAALYTIDNLPYHILFSIGKMLEISGLILWIKTLLEYLGATFPEITYSFGNIEKN